MYLSIWTLVSFSAAICCIGLILGLRFRTTKYREKAVYYDSSGVSSNPPSVFELTARKTLNFKVDDKYTISIPQISVGEGIVALAKLQRLYGELLKTINDAAKEEKEPSEKKLVFLTAAIAGTIFGLAKNYSKGGKKLLKAFLNRSLKDSGYLFQITRELIDFWVKKKALLQRLEMGKSSMGTAGGHAYIATLRLPVIPRFMKSLCGFSLN